MSTNLYWKKVVPTRHSTLGDGLKWAIQKRYGHGPTVLTQGDIGFLEGVKAGQFRETDETAVDAQKLIDAIQDNDAGIAVWIDE